MLCLYTLLDFVFILKDAQHDEEAKSNHCVARWIQNENFQWKQVWTLPLTATFPEWPSCPKAVNCSKCPTDRNITTVRVTFAKQFVSPVLSGSLLKTSLLASLLTPIFAPTVGIVLTKKMSSLNSSKPAAGRPPNLLPNMLFSPFLTRMPSATP